MKRRKNYLVTVMMHPRAEDDSISISSHVFVDGWDRLRRDKKFAADVDDETLCGYIQQQTIELNQYMMTELRSEV